jgi:hypothetical protein
LARQLCCPPDEADEIRQIVHTFERLADDAAFERLADDFALIHGSLIMGAKVRGIRQAKANLDRIIGRPGRRLCARQSAMLIGSAQAALYTPIDTSTLINSQFREITANGVRVTGRVGYG